MNKTMNTTIDTTQFRAQCRDCWLWEHTRICSRCGQSFVSPKSCPQGRAKKRNRNLFS